MPYSSSVASNWPFFIIFTSSAMILSFGNKASPLPKPEASYNDDVSIPPYEAASRIFAEKQRMDIHGDIPESSALYYHVELACQLPCFLAQETPLPPALTLAHLCMAECDGQSISAFW